MHRRAFLPNDWTMFYLKWEQKAPRLWQGCFGGNQTLVFCAAAETEALMRCVGQMVGAGGAHWPLCAPPLDSPFRPLTRLDSSAPTESDPEAAKRPLQSGRVGVMRAYIRTHTKTRGRGRQRQDNPEACIRLLHAGAHINPPVDLQLI